MNLTHIKLIFHNTGFNLQSCKKKERRKKKLCPVWLGGQGQKLCVLNDLVEMWHLPLAELPEPMQTSFWCLRCLL